MENTNTSTEKKSVAITPDVLRKHWQGHRRVTRRLIEAFPEDKLFTYSIGGMRPASELFLEMIGMSKPGMNGVATGFWDTPGHHKNQDKPTTRHDLLRLWDEVTNQIDELWSQIPASRFIEVDVAFGQWEGPLYGIIFYWIDNEIHHRGQAYVYLRSLGIEPPVFWDRE
jgi:uncharacterized damage-inducible protein DinB